ncbi:stage V sporulation protein B [Desulfitobacterium sp. Sab5]|uniref:stage V sporulation protein B n=1 Tax=Desulfitobacterium nosdiversum TaxID=3375356 RepID=UPI003CF1F7E0
MAKRTFVYGATILFAANFLNRILGFIYQYLIMTHIGGEAYGLFNMVFPVYMMALVLTTAGIPLAVSKMVSEALSLDNLARMQNIFRLSLTFLSFSGGFVAISLFFLSPYLADHIFPDPRVLRVFLVCTPAILIVSISSAFRGYFQGLQNMVPTALSQISEQILRVLIGFSAAIYLAPRGAEWAATGLALGMLAGEVMGLIVISIHYQLKKIKSYKDEPIPSVFQVYKELFTLSSPVTAGRLISTGLSSLDAMLIPQRLQIAGYTAREATTLFGQLGGSAFTLLTFPSVFTFALATSLVPAISEASARNQHYVVKARSSEAIRLTILLGLPCLLILFYFANPLTAFFKSQNIAPILRILTLGGIFSYLQQTTTGILQGLGKVYIPVIHSIISALLRIPILYVLTAQPTWGLTGTALAYVFGFFIMALLNIGALIRYTGMPLDLQRFFLQPISAGIGMMLLFKLTITIAESRSWFVLIQIIIGLICYFAILILNGGITLNDLRKLPWLGKYIPV